MNLAGQTAVITGAASGIGREMARRFGASGMQLMLADVEREPLGEVEAELVGTDPQTDLALLKVSERDLTEIRLAATGEGHRVASEL